MKFELKPFSRKKNESAQNVSSEELLDDLKRVLKQINKPTVTYVEYREHGKYGSRALVKRFGQSWFDVVAAAGLDRSRTYYGVTIEEYFKNLEDVWIALGRQPLRQEVEKPLSKYSWGAYQYKFGTWRKALEAFVAYMNADESGQSSVEPIVKQEGKFSLAHKTNRQVSDRLRFRVFYRDGMTCKICGKNRAKYPDLEIVVDHIFPWAKGGETVLKICKPFVVLAMVVKATLAKAKVCKFIHRDSVTRPGRDNRKFAGHKMAGNRPHQTSRPESS